MPTQSTPAPAPAANTDESMHDPNIEIAQHSLNIGADEVVAVTANLPENQRTAIRWLFAHAKQNKLGLTPLAAEVGLNRTTLYRVLKGQYGAKLDGIVSTITSYRRLVEERTTLSNIDYVETSIGKKIWQACEWALISQSMVMIYGNRGIGKTTAFESFQKAHNHGQTRYVRLPASAGLQLMMKEIARACMLSPESSYENLRERVLRSLDSSNLLIVDELHQVFLSYQRGSAIKCLEVLREIHDRTKCGIVLSGTSQLKRNVTIGQNVELLEQFTDRGVLQVQLPTKVPMRDVWKIAAAYGLVEHPEGRALDLVNEIMEGRSLRKFSKLLQATSRLAAKAAQPIAWSHFVSTHTMLAKLGQEEA